MAINVEAFYDMIDGIAERRVSATPMDLTIDAEVTKIVNIDIGEYKVEHQGSVFSAFSNEPEVTYNVGERVYVLVPQGDFSTKKVILGRSAYNNDKSYDDLQHLTNLFIDQGPNWVDKNNYRLDHTPLEICAVPGQSKEALVFDNGEGAHWADEGFRRWPETEELTKLLNSIDQKRYSEDKAYQQMIDKHLAAARYTDPAVRQAATFLSDDELAIIDRRFQNYAKSFTWLKIKANFRTDFNSPHKTGKYSLKVTFIEDNPKYVEKDPTGENEIGDPRAIIRQGEQQYQLATYELAFKDFIGSPYQMPVSTPQTAYFDIKKSKLKGLYRVTLVQDGDFEVDYRITYDEEGNIQLLPENAVLDENNIFCDEIDIRFCKKVNLLDTLYSCWIETPYGDGVYGPNTVEPDGRPSVDLVPHFQYQKTEVTKDCDIYWFREDLSVMMSTPETETADKYGRVWTEYSGPGWRPIEQYIDGSDKKYVISPDTKTLTVSKEAIPWERRFKLVCVYQEGVFGEAIVTVRNEDSTYDLFLEKFTDDNSNHTKLRINDWNHQVGKDALVDTFAGQTKPRDDFDKDDGRQVIYYPEWFGTWYVQLPDNSYVLATEEAWYLRGPLDITNWLMYDTVTFRVACYDPIKILPPHGEGDIASGLQYEEVGYLELTLNNVEDFEVLVDWIGRKQFNYTAQGTAYPNVSKNEYTLQPKLRWQFSDPLSYSITIIAPDGAILGSRDFYNQDNEIPESGFANVTGLGHQPIGSMMTDMYVDSDNVVHFKVRQELETTRSANTLIARVHTVEDDKFYEAPCEVIFTKDGQQGTQGSEWSAPIDLTNSEALRFKRWDGIQKEYYYSAMPAYTQHIGLPTYPLVVDRLTKPDGTQILVDSGEHRVFLRPFPLKEGRDLMAYQEEGVKYKIVTTWDVRYGQSALYKPARGASFLRLHDPYRKGALIAPKSAEPGINFAVGQTNPPNADGLYGMTVWDGSQGRDNERNRYYGAVEVRFWDTEHMDTLSGNPDPRTSMLAAMCYNFVVRATVDIYTNEEHTFKIKGYNKDYYEHSGEWYRVKTIVSYMPIDVFIRDGEQEIVNGQPKPKNRPRFNPTKCAINWPRDIQYDARGYCPTIDDEFLEFYYGFYPDRDRKDSVPNFAPKSLTESVQTVTVQKNLQTNATGSNAGDLEGNASSDKQNILEGYKLKPRAHLNWQEGTVGALATQFTEQKEEHPLGVFIRNQVYTVNAYANVDINSWDGQSIDINEDNGTIFAPTIGAGYKLPTSNRFTGVLMGINLDFRKDGTYASDAEDQDNLSGVNQLAQVGATKEELAAYPYMTGLFGYQDGYSSFGLLENGTAFFGRADRGGRIIIDGYNATIYGGANGVFSSPKIGDPMWNNMRITLVDLSHATSKATNTGEGFERVDDGMDTTNKEKALEQGVLESTQQVSTTPVQGIYQGFNGSYFGNEDLNRRDPYGVSNNLPFWYEATWRGAYFKPKGKSPYFLAAKEKGTQVDDDMAPFVNTEVEVPNITANGHKIYRPQKTLAPWLEELVNTEVLEDLYNNPDGVDIPGYGQSGSLTKLAKNRKNIAVDYWDPDLDKIRKYTQSYNRMWSDGTGEIKDTQQLTGFGPSRASTTPAIEIGQHPPGLMPGPISWDYDLDEIFSDLFIPGDRNFLVTYDGTMWAMNGVFLGNILGSNIIGGRIRGAEIGIGDKPEEGKKMLVTSTSYDDWQRLVPPILEPSQEVYPTQFYVGADGTVFCNRIFITGGSLHLGRFHVIGDKIGNSSVEEKEQGHLIQFGHSDFVGPVHFYGNVGVGPDLGTNNQGKLTNTKGDKNGNFFQTRGIAALGIIMPGGNTKFHALYAKTIENYRDSSIGGLGMMDGGELTYLADKTTPGDPGIQKGFSVEQTAIFAVDSTSSKTVEEMAGGSGGDNKTPQGTVLDVGVTQGEFSEEWQKWDRAHKRLQALCGDEQEMFEYMYSKRSYMQQVLGTLLPGFTWGTTFWDGSNYTGAVNFNGEDYRKLAAAAQRAIALLPTSAGGQDAIAQAPGSTTDGYRGHFWPMAYRYFLSGVSEDDEQQTNTKAINGYQTTMDIFRSKPFTVSNGTNDKGKTDLSIDGGNYFRVGPWGQEGCRYYICAQWQKQDESKPPAVNRKGDVQTPGTGVRGYMGLVNRAGDGSTNPISYAIGMTSWGKAPIIFSSDSEFAVRTKNSTWFYGLCADTAAEKDLDSTSVSGKWQITFGGGSIMPSGGGSGPGQPSFQANVTGENKPFIKFQVAKGKYWGDEELKTTHSTIGVSANSINDYSGLSLDPFNFGQLPDGGTYLYSREKDIHIIRIKNGEKKLCYDKKGGITEGLFKEDEIVLYASKKVTIGWGEEQSAHIENESEWKHAAIFKDKGITIINNGDPSSSDQGQGGGTSTPPTLAKPSEKKYCIYLGSKDNVGGTSEITWQEHFIGIAGKQVAVSGGGSPAHSPVNYMLFAQNTIDMKGAYATPDNQHHIYARFG